MKIFDSDNNSSLRVSIAPFVFAMIYSESNNSLIGEIIKKIDESSNNPLDREINTSNSLLTRILNKYRQSIHEDDTIKNKNYYIQNINKLGWNRFENYELQWAELISTPNTSGGVPCTISSIGNRLIPECSEVRDPRAEIVSDYAKSSSDAAKCLSDAIAIAEELAAPGAKVPKSQIIKLKEAIAAAQRELAGTAPFYLKQFTESCDKITTEAKATIEASYLHVVNVLGNQKIAELTGGGLPAAPQAPAIEGPRGEPVYDVPRLLCSKCWNPEVSPLPDKSSVQCAGCGEIRGIPTGAVVVKFRRRGKDGAKFYFHLRDEIDGHECDDGGVSELDLIGGEN